MSKRTGGFDPAAPFQEETHVGVAGACTLNLKET